MLSRRALITSTLLSSVLYACRSGLPRSSGTELADLRLEQWIASQRALSVEHMLRNISPPGPVERDVVSNAIAADRLDDARRAAAMPGATIEIGGGRLRLRILPKAGSVEAAAPGKPDEPDYFFHWIRDSALVMREVATLATRGPPDVAAANDRRFQDFIRFSRSLQLSGSKEGLGEVRFNMDGTEDYLQWSRPQMDGAPLRALTLMYYKEQRRIRLPGDSAVLLHETLRTDLDFIAANWTRTGFDLWEEYSSHDYHTRVVQLAALRLGATWAQDSGDRERAELYLEATAGLGAVLAQHWLPDRGYYGFHVGPTIYWNGKDQVKPGKNFDAAVLMAAVHGHLPDGPHSLLDERILSTAALAEDLFGRLYRINDRRDADQGVLYGRYEGDAYFGGNPLVFTTFEFAEAHYRIAWLLASKKSLRMTDLNQRFLTRALERARLKDQIAPGQDLLADGTVRAALQQGLMLRGDDILRAVRPLASATGELPEQFDHTSGAPASCRNLTWSHSAFLAATNARADALDQLHRSV